MPALVTEDEEVEVHMQGREPDEAAHHSNALTASETAGAGEEQGLHLQPALDAEQQALPAGLYASSALVREDEEGMPEQGTESAIVKVCANITHCIATAHA